ncbi:MAG TPA: hypothetical protein VML91_10830 [Burkholderiales bacterium]|nr:hypothetical protein [Burkholderiales bacterium]
MKGERALLARVLAYAAASLFHHAHNAAYLSDYPGMPAWLTPAGVYVAWLATTTVGAAGDLLLRSGYRLAGFGTIAHYGVAPASAHSPTMHLTIALEATTGTLVLAGAVWLIASEMRERMARA